MTSIKCTAILLAYLLTGCGREFACPVSVDIISDDHNVRMAYLEAMDWINTESGQYIFTIGKGDIRAFGWDAPGAQARNGHNFTFIGKSGDAIQKIFAAHELLHLLGLEHDELPNSMMNAFVGPESAIYPQHIEYVYDYCGY